MTPRKRSNHTPRKPRRYLDPRLAGAISESKEQSGLTWREISARCGVSHSHLVNLAGGKRVPSRRTVFAIAEVLRLGEHVLTDLLEVAQTPVENPR